MITSIAKQMPERATPRYGMMGHLFVATAAERQR
jgi:hypothetical protein